MKRTYLEEIQGKCVHLLDLSLTYTDELLELSMKINSNEIFYNIAFHGVSRVSIQNLSPPLVINGFEIICCKQNGWESDSSYMVNDFEDGRIRFFCEDFDIITVLQ